MKVLVKFGGTLLDDSASRDAVSAQVAEATRRNGIQLVVVHGGGKQMTRYLTERGVESQFVDGLRVTSPEIVDAILKVFAGSVNKSFVGALNKAGASSVGITGIDAGLTDAEIMDPKLGAVGRIVKSDARILDVLVSGGFVPVVACVAGDRQARVYNVNADQMAVACAAAWKADKLLFLTDVDGVRGADGQSIADLSVNEAQNLIDVGIATGGMQAKLTAAISALEQGLQEVRIVRGSIDGILRQVLDGERVGTSLRKADSR